MDTKIRLLQLGMKQVDLIKALESKGIHANATEISRAINETGNQPKHKEIKKSVDEILTEIEGNK